MNGRFPTTPWSVIRTAALNGDTQAREAMSALCRAYWYPLHARSLEIYERNGVSHENIARARRELAVILRELDRDTEADSLLDGGDG